MDLLDLTPTDVAMSAPPLLYADVLRSAYSATDHGRPELAHGLHMLASRMLLEDIAANIAAMRALTQPTA